MAVDVRDAQAVHQLAVARGDRDAVNLCGDAVAADFLDVADAAAVDLFAVGALQALADRVGGGALHQRGVFQNLFVHQFVVVDAADLKDALGQGAGFIKDDNLGLRESLQIVGALDQHAGVARSADAGKEGERDADDQRTGAADDQEGQGAINPVAPGRVKSHEQHADQRRQDGQRQRGIADSGGVDAGKFGDKVLRLGFAGAGVLHQVQNFGDGGLAELLGGADL